MSYVPYNNATHVSISNRLACNNDMWTTDNSEAWPVFGSCNYADYIIIIIIIVSSSLH